MNRGLLLDTHVLVWWRRDRSRLSRTQVRTLLECEERQEPFGISAVTLWELAKLIQLGRLRVSGPLDLWLEEIEQHPLIRVYPISAKIAALSVQLGEDFHKDPADQIIVATARRFGLPLVTCDERIRHSGKVATI